MSASSHALLVDVGYLYAAAAGSLLGAGSRRDYRVDSRALITALKGHAADTIGGRLLRVYWYDAARDRVPTIDHRLIAPLPQVKLRLGNLNRQGQQKGVDAQVRTDLETLAGNHAVTDVILLAGDEDLVPGVEAAQAHGVLVHLWGIEPVYGSNQSERLIWECDDADRVPQTLIAPFFERVVHAEPEAAPTGTPTPLDVLAGATAKPPAAPRPNGAGTTRQPAQSGPDRRLMHDVGEHVAQKWILTRGRDNMRDLLPGPKLPTVIDQELLVEAEKELDFSLRPYQEARTWVRDGFWDRVYREFGIRS